ncbi:MAG: redoxin domain-containing protein [Planctomycetota bacterium]|nr:redoxin domain-containing protein [Planctomycetota bacterium]MDA1251289.1 redoxin domain-containing protein [Planctomycetota bacterium]
MNAVFKVAVISLALPVVAAGQADSLTPAQQYSAILNEYRPASGGTRSAKTDLERKEAVERMGSFASKFVELAAKFPKDPVALSALRDAVQVVGSTDSAAQIAWETSTANFPSGCNDGSAAKTVELVLRDHVLSDQLEPVVDRMRYGYRMEYAECLSTILEKNPHRNIQGTSCLYLAQMLNDRLGALQLAEDRQELAECYDIVFGKGHLPGLRKLGEDKLAARVESLFERAAREYADVKIRAGTVGEAATKELYAIRNLTVGRVAPDIEGKDQDGKEFQLSDYRGKVVLLYFWSEF